MIIKDNDRDFPCQIVAPVMEDFHFNVLKMEPSFYKLPLFSFSSSTCQQMFDSNLESISYSIFEDIKRPEVP